MSLARGRVIVRLSHGFHVFAPLQIGDFMAIIWSTERRQLAMDAICERISFGESLLQICGHDNMPGKTVVYEWLQKYHDFAEQYQWSREFQADFFADQVLEVARSVRGKSREEILAARLLVDALRWRAGQQSGKWNSRARLTHSETAGVQFNINLASVPQTTSQDPIPLLPE